MSSKPISHEEVNWQETWATVFHCIWKWCNKIFFDKVFIVPHSMVSEILKRLQQYATSTEMNNKRSMNKKTEIYIKWEPLEHEWLTLNIVGSVQQSKKVGCMGLLRDKAFGS